MAIGKKTGGRQAGTPNKTASDIKALAQSFGPAAIMRLAELAGFAPDLSDPTGKLKLKGAENEAVQVSATKELLDRGYGKAVQPQSGPDGESNPVIEVIYRWDSPKPE